MINDWAGHYKKEFMTDMAKAQNEKHTNAEWKQLRLEKEQRLGYSRRKHGQRHSETFRDSRTSILPNSSVQQRAVDEEQ
eukprot:1305452-Amphidinium_carterae.1